MSDRPLVGVGVVVRRDDKVLLHKRKGDHGGGTWAFPGGHLELFESFENCALRELEEEAGEIVVTQPKYWTTVNTRFYDEGKHYVVVFMVCDWISGEPTIMEPDKCECWEWHGWYKLPSPLMQGLQILKDEWLNPISLDMRYV